jgi:hypothetical protein
MTATEIAIAAEALMAAIQARVAEREALQLTLGPHTSPRERRRVRELSRELSAANRADRKRLARLDAAWEATHVALAS